MLLLLQTCTLEVQKDLVAANRVILQKYVDDAYKEWEVYENADVIDATKNAESAVTALQKWHEQRFQLHELDRTLANDVWLATSLGLQFRAEDTEERRAKSHHKAELVFVNVAANVYATQFGHEQQQLLFIDKMWKQLWEEQKQEVDVYPARTTLLKLGQQCYSRYLTASALAVSRDMEADMTKLLAPETPDNKMRNALKRLRARNEKEQAEAGCLMVRFQEVFGNGEADMESAEQPKADMETAKTSTIEMLKIARSKGYLHCVLPTKDVLEDRKRFVDEVEGLIDAETVSMEDLEALVYPTGKVYPEDTFRFLQNTFGLQPNSKLFDTWFHLFIEALKDFLISGNRWTDSNWTMTTLPG
eukprot:GHVS01001250.1.p1 GENE.GHVS01001250.1~~GHVS01001250.1.p1  ORF type:complete len:360 (+),score=35.13 GHVS01001250.1:319-1398(+)